MAEVMSMIPESTGETDVQNLTADEQDSLSIGQQMEDQQNQLLAGKYKSAKDLENAYIELQKKLGSQDKEAEPEAAEPEAEAEEAESVNFLDQLWNESQAESFSDDTRKQLESMSKEDLANLYLEYRSNNSNQPQQQQQQVMTEADVTGLKNIVGGEENYQNMIQWASQNVSEGDIEMFDAVMDSGDPRAAFFAIQAMAYRYQDAVGTEGKMVQGKAPSQTENTFRSQAELVRAMSDPRYDSDPAYRQDVMNKLAASNNVSF